jgi:predicted phage tail protein
MERQLYKINLHGTLGTSFSEEVISVYATSVKDVFTALCSRFGQSFKSTIQENSWQILQGNPDKENFLSEELLDFPVEDRELHIFPAISGAGGKGIGQIILGVVLIIIAVVLVLTGVGAPAGAGIISGLTAGGLATSVALAGVLAIAGGVMAMMTKSPTANYGSGSNSASQNPSFIYSGAVNTTAQGVPVPLVYGIHPTGSVIISAGIDVLTL